MINMTTLHQLVPIIPDQTLHTTSSVPHTTSSVPHTTSSAPHTTSSVPHTTSPALHVYTHDVSRDTLVKVLTMVSSMYPDAPDVTEYKETLVYDKDVVMSSRYDIDDDHHDDDTTTHDSRDIQYFSKKVLNSRVVNCQSMNVSFLVQDISVQQYPTDQAPRSPFVHSRTVRECKFGPNIKVIATNDIICIETSDPNMLT
jgi:hypothetical protein